MPKEDVVTTVWQHEIEKKQPQGCKNHTKQHHTMFPMNLLPRGMGRSFLARSKHGHMQCQFRAARSTLLPKGLQSQETKKLTSTAQAHSSTMGPLLGNKILGIALQPNREANSYGTLYSHTSSSRASRWRKFQKKKELYSKERICL